jgi:hypothetical protein
MGEGAHVEAHQIHVQMQESPQACRVVVLDNKEVSTASGEVVADFDPLGAVCARVVLRHHPLRHGAPRYQVN